MPVASDQSRRFVFMGSINAFLAVALGAFGAHGLKAMLSPQALQTWQTAFEYHIYHALGLILIALLLDILPKARIAGWLMLAGIILFSGSLYLLALSGIKMLGMITPLGGLCFLAAWAWLALLSLRTKRG
ncbi:MAG: DUF423 domain-containing protein [Gammaproteobacteria bacterium]